MPQAVVETGSNLLDVETSESWKDLPQSEQRESATQLVQAVEQSALQVAERIDKPTAPVINIEVNIGEEFKT